MIRYRMLKQNDEEKKEYHRMRHALWPKHDEADLYEEMLKIVGGIPFYKNELSWTVFVAEREDGRLGGFIEITLYPSLAFCSTSPVAYIEGWYVDDDLRRCGVGKVLVKTAINWAAENGCTEIASDVELGNLVSQLAHQALGFREDHKDNVCIYYKRSIDKSQIKITLVIPKKGEDLKEMEKFLKQEEADIYIFPEGFLETEQLPEALRLIKETDRYVITGLKDTRTDNSYQTALIIDKGNIVGDYRKNILTQGEKEKGRVPGESIYCLDTKYGKIGIPICYEIHFPEVPRVMALEAPFMLVNLIGTGMYHEQQYDQWTTLAKARAIENEVYVLGCSHYAGEIPLAFAFSPKGEMIVQSKKQYGSISLHIDRKESYIREISYHLDRLPDRFVKLCE